VPFPEALKTKNTQNPNTSKEPTVLYQSEESANDYDMPINDPVKAAKLF
jgi:hypothetical protein